jgi:hypothetical protein
MSRITIASMKENLLFFKQYTPSMPLEPASPKAAQSHYQGKNASESMVGLTRTSGGCEAKVTSDGAMLK